MSENLPAIAGDGPQFDLPAIPKPSESDLYSALLLDARKETTRKARAQDIADLALFLGDLRPELGQIAAAQACSLFISGGSGRANALATAYVAHMLSRKLAPSTINRRSSTLRRLVRLARKFGVIDWVLEIDSQRVKSFRDTTGPGRAGWLRLLDVASRDARRTRKGRRDLAILRLLHDQGLRRSEVAALDLGDVDLDAGRIQVLGKGRAEREPMTCNGPTLKALSEWIDARGPAAGPLFVRLDRAAPKDRPGRLDGDSILNMVSELGRRAKLGKKVRPHGLRHQGITRVLELTNGNIDMAQKFGRHSDPKTTQRYNDNRTDLAGAAARLLGDDA